MVLDKYNLTLAAFHRNVENHSQHFQRGEKFKFQIQKYWNLELAGFKY